MSAAHCYEPGEWHLYGVFVALSQFAVANGMGDDVRAAFEGRPHRVDAEDGFVRMEVLCPVEASEEFWLMTWWADEQSYRRWHHGHTFKASHSGIPKGLKLDPKRTKLRFFERVSE